MNTSSEPLAYFLTWTTYGTWLPGDARGWVRADRPGVWEECAALAASCRERLTEPPFVLTTDQRRIAESAIREHCEVVNWSVHALNVRSNHIHIVMTAVGKAGDRVMSSLKSYATRGLKSVISNRKKFWTRGGSARVLWDDFAFENAVRYVIEDQDRK
ncbi:transposase [Stratiformator vulcanicus]|uniref:Transposase IS200 like protein n=1 Tax=Stratiformator vulcanicus TaxID=2527980 RepID=A0A517R4Y0_9PLAN|nr:transposase [Stratiformator vulcanicus]QDT38934.1 Transposase IS200 like protein [Stratiformator vulcanicus]